MPEATSVIRGRNSKGIIAYHFHKAAAYPLVAEEDHSKALNQRWHRSHAQESAQSICCSKGRTSCAVVHSCIVANTSTLLDYYL